MLLQWTESSGDITTPISIELNQLEEKGIINSWETLMFVSDGHHFDDQFSTALQSLPMDTVGSLVDRASIDGGFSLPRTHYEITYLFLDVFQMFFAPWDTSLNEWISSCQLTQGIGCEYHILYMTIY